VFRDGFQVPALPLFACAYRRGGTSLVHRGADEVGAPEASSFLGTGRVRATAHTLRRDSALAFARTMFRLRRRRAVTEPVTISPSSCGPAKVSGIQGLIQGRMSEHEATSDAEKIRRQ